jgi:hypothetical protein
VAVHSNRRDFHLKKIEDMISYQAIFVTNGMIRRVTFEAMNQEEAQQLAALWGCGLEGEAKQPSKMPIAPTLPEAYEEPVARQLLGNISRTTLYRLLVRGKLERVKDTRKVLVTRRSIERFCSRAA